MQMKEELLSILQYELGEVIDWDELCPGAYYFGVEPNPDRPAKSWPAGRTAIGNLTICF